MPEDERPEEREGDEAKTWPESRRELVATVEELDKVCARARQLIYRLRPLMREAKSGSDDGEEAEAEARRPARGQFRRRHG